MASENDPSVFASATTTRSVRRVRASFAAACLKPRRAAASLRDPLTKTARQWRFSAHLALKSAADASVVGRGGAPASATCFASRRWSGVAVWPSTTAYSSTATARASPLAATKSSG